MAVRCSGYRVVSRFFHSMWPRLVIPRSGSIGRSLSLAMNVKLKWGMHRGQWDIFIRRFDRSAISSLRFEWLQSESFTLLKRTWRCKQMSKTAMKTLRTQLRCSAINQNPSHKGHMQLNATEYRETLQRVRTILSSKINECGWLSKSLPFRRWRNSTSLLIFSWHCQALVLRSWVGYFQW